jgi:KaiC/GvpD/RAD55 family RecA-like ATPase
MTATRVPSGIHGLDDLVGGGFPASRAVLIRGEAGAGKTAFALHFLMEGVRRGEAVALILADSTRPPINHRLAIALHESPLFTELQGRRSADARQLASDVTRQVRHLGVKRIVIDDAVALVGSDVPADGIEDFLRSLVLALEDNLGCTILMTARIGDDAQPSPAAEILGRLVSGVIEVRGRPTDRWLQIRKMRGAPSALEPYFVGGLSAPRSLSANEPNPSACATLSRAV